MACSWCSARCAAAADGSRKRRRQSTRVDEGPSRSSVAEQGPPPPAPTTRKEARYRAALDAGHISRDAYDRAVAEPDTEKPEEAEKVAQKPGSLVDRVVRVTKGSHDKKLSGSLGMVEAWDSRRGAL